MFRASSTTAALAAGALSVELVWTGPGTGMVPVRHTAQVLTGLIAEARERLFLVSFVAYHVGTVIAALQRAIEHGVQVSVLLERSKEHGGTVTVDSIFSSVGHQPLQAARQVMSFLTSTKDAEALINAGRRLIFLKGNDSHDYKFSTAALEDFAKVHPARRNQFLASSMYNLKGSGDADNKLVERIRAALA